LDPKFLETFDGLIEKYTELVIGKSDDELKEKIKVWALYNHISKTMPALTNHWGQSFPEEKEVIKELYGEVKKLNEEYRKQVHNK